MDHQGPPVPPSDPSAAEMAPPAAAPPPAAEPGGWPRWPWWFGFIGFVAALLVPGVIGLLIGIGAAAGGLDLDPDAIESNPAFMIGGAVIQDGAFVLAAVLLAWTVSRPRAWQFGLRRPRRFWPAVGLSFLTLVAAYAFTFAYTTGFGINEEQSTLDDLGVGDSATMTAAAAVLVVILAPLVEEFFFRGFVYRSFRTSLGVWPAALGAGAIFGVIHAPTGIAAVPILIFLGVALCLLYERTGSLYAPIAVHAVNNSIAFAAATADSDPVLPLALGGGLLVVLGIVARLSGGRGPYPARAPV